MTAGSQYLGLHVQAHRAAYSHPCTLCPKFIPKGQVYVVLFREEGKKTKRFPYHLDCLGLGHMAKDLEGAPQDEDTEPKPSKPKRKPSKVTKK